MFRQSFIALVLCVAPLFGQTGNPAVTTGQYDNGRTSTNLNETVLNTSNVNSTQFGRLFSWSVDGQIYAQPLYAPGVQIAGRTTNVVFVATMKNNLYAFDAANPGAPALWSLNLGPSVSATTASHGCPTGSMSGPQLGILSTPVIDLTTNTLYVIAATPGGNGFVHYLHAIDISTHLERSGSPILIDASVPGTGYDAQGGQVDLNYGGNQTQRTALLLANGKVYAGFGNCGPDVDPWHGWVIGYSTTNLQSTPSVKFNTTPNGGQGGVWQSGRGLVADASGDVYFSTGNATDYDTADDKVTTGTSSGDTAKNDYPQRLIQLSSAGQFVASYPPANYPFLNDNDLDLSASGPLLIPGTTLLVAGGKDGMLYLLDSANLNAPKQSFLAAGSTSCASGGGGCGEIHAIGFWNSTLYVWAINDVLKTYKFQTGNNQFSTSPSSQNTLQSGWPPASFAISAKQTTPGTGIVWATTLDNVLHAYDASNVATELWNSNQNSGRDALPSAPHFTEPTVANGRVYVATQSNQLAVYGLLNEFSLSTSTTSQPVYQGTSAAFALNLTPLAGFSGPVNFSITGLPSGATATFSPTSLNGSGSSTVNISTTSSTPTGTYNLIISGTGGGVTHTASLSLVVTTPDTTAPQWTCCTYTTSGSNYTLGFSGWDAESGMQSIQATTVVNASVSIPTFTAGTNNTINFSATESGWSSYVQFQLTDVAGNVSYVDPCYVDASRMPGQPVPFKVKTIWSSETKVTIINGSPGLKNFRISAEGLTNYIEVAGLHDGESRVVDILSLLPTSGATDMYITPLGKPGGSAVIFFAPFAVTPLLQ